MALHPEPDTTVSNGTQHLPAPVTSVLKQRDFRRLLYSGSAESVGDDVLRSLLPIVAVSVLGVGALQVSILTALSLSAFLILGIPAGVWVDRMRKQRVLIGADLFRALVVASVPVAYLLGFLSIWQIFVVAALVSVADVFFNTARSTVMPMVVRPQQLSEGAARLLSADNTASVATPALSGVLLRFAAAPVVLLTSSLAYVVSALAMSRMQLEEPRSFNRSRTRFWASASEGLSFTIRHRLLRAHFTSIMLINASTMFGGAAQIVFALTVLEIPPSVVAALSFFAAGGALLGSIVAMPVLNVFGIGRTRILASLASVAAAALVPLSPLLPISPVIWLAASGFGWSFLTAITFVAGSGIVARITQQHMLGRVSSCIRMFTLGIMPIASITGGLIATTFGLVPTLWIWAFLAGCAALPILLSPIRSWKLFPEHLDVNNQ